MASRENVLISSLHYNLSEKSLLALGVCDKLVQNCFHCNWKMNCVDGRMAAPRQKLAINFVANPLSSV